MTHNATTVQIDNPVVKGYDFNQGVDYEKLFESYRFMGIQSTNLRLAMDQINNMIKWRGENNERCTIFLGYTSNMISCGVRDIIRFIFKWIIRYLCEHNMVDCLVTTCGGIEEDFIKCMGKIYIG